MALFPAATLFLLDRARGGRIEGQAGVKDWELPRVEAVVRDELKQRRRLAVSGQASRDGLPPMTWLKNTCYKIILAWLAADLFEKFEERVENRFQRGTKKTDRDVFQLGIVGIFATEATELSVRDRERLAAPMWYAFRHYIPPGLLDGFNSQYPGHKGERLGWRDFIEPSLEAWVVEQRAQSFDDGSTANEYRGQYPSRINRAAEAIQAQRDEEVQRRIRDALPPRSEVIFDDDNW